MYCRYTEFYILFLVFQDLDSYLKSRSPVTFLSDLRSNLQVTGVICNVHVYLEKYILFLFCMEYNGVLSLQIIGTLFLKGKKIAIYMFETRKRSVTS